MRGQGSWTVLSKIFIELNLTLRLEFYLLERGFALRHSVTVSILHTSVNYSAFTKEYVICDLRSRFQEVLTVKGCDWGIFGVG